MSTAAAAADGGVGGEKKNRGERERERNWLRLLFYFPMMFKRTDPPYIHTHTVVICNI